MRHQRDPSIYPPPLAGRPCFASTRHPGASSPPSRSGFHIFNLALDATSVWVVSFEDNMVARIDPATNAVTMRQSLPNAPSGVLINEGLDGVDSDASSNHVARSLPASGRPYPATAGQLWVLSIGGQVSRIAA
jgi:hypothetical protein